MNLGLRNRSGALKKIEVAAFMSLGDVLHEELAVAAGIDARCGPPLCAAAREFLVTNAHVEFTGRNIQFDRVAFPQERERPPYERFGSDVKYTSSVTCTAHACVRYTDHVSYARFQQLLRDGKIAPFRHTGCALGPGVPQHQNAVRVDVKSWIVNANAHLIETVEDDGAARMFEQLGLGSRSFDDRSEERRVGKECR